MCAALINNLQLSVTIQSTYTLGPFGYYIAEPQNSSPSVQLFLFEDTDMVKESKPPFPLPLQIPDHILVNLMQDFILYYVGAVCCAGNYNLNAV